MSRYEEKYWDAGPIIHTPFDDDEELFGCEIKDNETGLVGTTHRARSSKTKAYNDAWEDLMEKQKEYYDSYTRNQYDDRIENYQNKSNDNGLVSLIGWIIAGGIVIFLIFIAIWVAVNVILPIALLNSAIVFTFFSLIFKQRKTLFASLAFIGGIYMILDIINSWLSLNFVEKVVKSPDWISAFVYINASALGLCTWFLIQPIWLKTERIEPTEKRKSLLLKGALVLLIAIATAVAPVIYHSVQNPFILKSQNSIIGDEIEGDTDAPVNILPNSTDSRSPNSNIPGMFPQASIRLLTSSDLNGMSKQDLKIMRNEIFARHGYIFKSNDMKSYFATQSWYQGQYDNVNSLLSNIEQQNIALIKKHE